MGVSTDAMIYFGVELGDEHDLWEKAEELWEHPEIDLQTHCSSDYPVWFVCIKKSFHLARRGYPVFFEDELKTSKEVEEEWSIKLMDFLREHDLMKYVENPKCQWTLASNWS